MSDTLDSDRWYPDVLVLGPGGIKGFLELGALIKLTSVNYLERVHTYIGCSVGALISLLLICGYTPLEILSDAINENIFKDITNLSITDVFKDAGMISNEQIRKKLTARLEHKFGFVPTLSKLYLATGLSLITVTLNLTEGKVEYLSKESKPDLSSIDAVLFSINVPFLFRKIKHQGCTYIDGAFGNPYPVDILDDGKNNILGIYINLDSNDHESENNLLAIVKYFYSVFHASIGQLKIRIQKTSSSHCRHIELKSPIIDITEFTALTQDMKSKMLSIGYQEAEKFLSDDREIISNVDDEVSFEQ
jgi:predicted acylesterase/phospholipase RssA